VKTTYLRPIVIERQTAIGAAPEERISSS